MSRISIVIPIYNGARYIKTCYESLRDQSIKDWEAVFVNDGSTDESQEILNEIAGFDDRVIIYKQSNAGQIQARYKGIEKSSGEYCVFLDIDDLFTTNALSAIISAIEEYDHPDIIMFNGDRVNSTGKHFAMWEDLNDHVKLYEGEKYNKLRGMVLDGRRLNNICFKAIKSSILKSNNAYKNTADIKTEEDLLMQLPYFDKARDLLYIPKHLYVYNINENSVTNTYDPNLFESACVLFRELYKYGKKWNLQDYKVRCVKRFLLSTISSVVKDSHNLNYSDFSRKLSRIRSNKIFIKASKKMPSDMSSTRKAYIYFIRYRLDYLCYLLGKKKEIVY